MREAQQLGAILLAGAAAAGLMLAPMAFARDDARLRQIEKASARAAQDHKNLTRQAVEAESAMRALSGQLVAAAQAREAAEHAMEDAHAKLSDAEMAANLASTRRRDARAVLAERAALLALTDNGNAPGLALLAAAGVDDALRVANDEDRATLAAQRWAVALATERMKLQNAESQLAVEEAKLSGLMAELRSRRARLAADTARQEARMASLSSQARSLRQLASVSVRRDRNRPDGARPLNARQAPLKGRTRLAYGALLPSGNPHPGETIATRANARVLAPATGAIVYAGVFRSYGKVLILDPGGGYAIVLAGLDHIQAETGQTVLAGQPVGLMGEDPPSAAQAAGDAFTAPNSSRQSLYWEVRRNDRPIDPRRWLTANQRPNQAIVNDRRGRSAKNNGPKAANGATG